MDVTIFSILVETILQQPNISLQEYQRLSKMSFICRMKKLVCLQEVKKGGFVDKYIPDFSEPCIVEIEDIDFYEHPDELPF